MVPAMKYGITMGTGGASPPWRYDPASHPCEAFAMLRWSTGPTVTAHPANCPKILNPAT